MTATMAMSDLSYKDYCEVTRATGKSDRYDNQIVEEIYSGRCDFQPGGQTSLSIITHDDVVYLPEAVMVMENDMITVRTRLGRIRSGIVKIANNLELDMTDDCITEIEIKHSSEK